VAEEGSGTKARRGLLIVFGALIGLFGLLVLAAGAALLYADRSLKDDEGYFASRMAGFEVPGRAITTQGLDLTGLPVGSDRWADIRIRARAADGRPIFLGVAREEAVRQYLAGVPHAVLTDVDSDSFAGTYRRVGGTRVPPAPATRTFWAVRVQGRGLRTLNWGVMGGNWQMVAMNADASPGVSVDASLGVKIPYTLATAIVLLAVGLLLAGGGLAMILRGGRRRKPPPDARDGPATVEPAPEGSGIRITGTGETEPPFDERPIHPQ
jgi:hypothetical protein